MAAMLSILQQAAAGIFTEACQYAFVPIYAKSCSVTAALAPSIPPRRGTGRTAYPGTAYPGTTYPGT